MAEAIFQGGTGKLWDLITAAIEHGFVSHLDLNRGEAGKMRGRNAVAINKEEPRTTNDDNVKDGPNVVDADNKKGRWMSRAGNHSMQASRLINVARRMQRMSSITDLATRKCNEANNIDTLAAYSKDAARPMMPIKFINDKKCRDEERKDGGDNSCMRCSRWTR